MVPRSRIVAAPQVPPAEASHHAMSRPLYRWKSFGFGVFVLVFLGWAWASSTNGLAEIGWGGSQASGFANQFGGRMNLRVDRQRSHPTGFRLHYQTRDSMGSPVAEVWPSDLKGGINPQYDRWAVLSIGVAHWFLILLFLVPWSGWLAWRWRRMRAASRYHDPECSRSCSS